MSTPDYLTLGHEIKQRRGALGLTAIALANVANVSLSSLQRLEQGVNAQRSPTRRRTLATLERLEAEQALKS